jgi:ABC-2 type transport system ATP-binding protein
MSRTTLTRSVAVALTAALLTPLAPARAEGETAPALIGPIVTNGCVRSVPDPGTDERVKICWTLFRPTEATRRHRVPVVMHSHGWGGSRTTDWRELRRWTEHGYAVLSYDQRGFGDSGGHAHVENPAVEGRDVARLVRMLSRKRWILKDGPGDPRLGAIGGSYGGGYQFLGAFTSLQRRGTEVFDALAPEITWNSLNTSLAPEGVVRTEWALALSAAAVPSDALPPHVYKALVEGAATGEWPDGSPSGTEDMESFFRRNGPSWHVRQGRRLDIPVLLGQGTTDTLFPLQQAITTWQSALTRRARRHSIFVGYNGGHVLPSVFPRGVAVTSDPCSRRLAGQDFAHLARRFFDHALKGQRTGLRGHGRLHIATPGSRCTSVRSARPNTAVRIGDVATTAAAGPPVAVEVAQGPVRIAGSARLTGTMTALGVNNRAFYGLAVGTSPADAHLVQNNVLPVNEPAPVLGERRRITLPAVAVDVPAGQNLYLLASAFSDTFAGMGSRTPGAILLEDTAVHVHRVGR